MDEWLQRDDGQRMWLNVETLRRVDELANRALHTPVDDSQVRLLAALNIM